MGETLSIAEIIQKARPIIAGVFGKDEEEILPEFRLKEDLGADIISMYDILIGIKNEFNIYIIEEELSDKQTVQDIYDFIKVETTD